MHLETFNNRTQQYFVVNPPSIPPSLVVTGTTSSTVSLSWGASSPGTYSIAGYEVFRNGAYVTTVAGTTFTDTGLASSTSYNYNVEAIDTQGNTSAQSNTASGTTGSSGGSLQINTSSLGSAPVGAAYSAPISVSGGSGAGYSVYIAQAVPNSLRWLQMIGATTLGGTPQGVELVSVTLIACDSAGNVSAPVTLTIQTTVSGALAFVSSTTTANVATNGILAQQQICSGGVPPYIHACPNQILNWTIDWDGFLYGAPASGSTMSLVDQVTDSAGTTITQTLTTTIGSGIGLSQYDYNTSQINLPNGASGQNYLYNFWAFGGIGSGYSCSITGGALAPGLSLSGLQITGAPTRAGTFFATVTVTDGTHSQAYTVCHQVWASDIVSRPGYNTGSGFFVANGKLYDPSGKRFTIRGVDRVHYDSSTWPNNTNGALTNCNAVRVFILGSPNTGATIASQCNTQYLPSTVGGTSGNYILPVLTLSGVTGFGGTSGSSSTPQLCAAMNVWLAAYPGGLSTVDSYVMYNIANEWGASYSSSTTAWLYSYEYVAGNISAISGATVTVSTVSATNPFANTPFCLIQNAGGITATCLNVQSVGGVSGAWTVTFTASPTGTYTSGGTLYGGAVGCMRGSGYLGPLVIDAGGAGQDFAGLAINAQAIQNSDPQQNCIFSYHAYGTAENYECTIQSVATGATTTLTLNSNLPYHPLVPSLPIYGASPSHPGNGSQAATSVVVTGALGMTSLNGTQALANTGGTNCAGSQGAWTVQLNVNSAGWTGTYVAGSGRLTVGPFDYRLIMASLAALRSSNVCVACLEFGPGNQMGSPAIAFNGYIDNGTPGVAGTVLHVTAMLTSGAILPATSDTAPVVYMAITTNGGSGITYPTYVLAQTGGTTGLIGTYTLDTSQLVGSSSVPVKIFVQSLYGTDSSWYGPSTGFSPCQTSIGQMISALEANLMGWCYWAFDDHNIGANSAVSNIGWFGMALANTNFLHPSDLTISGAAVVFNPCLGLRTLAQPSSYYV